MNRIFCCLRLIITLFCTPCCGSFFDMPLDGVVYYTNFHFNLYSCRCDSPILCTKPYHLPYSFRGAEQKMSLVNNPLIVHKVMVVFNCVQMLVRCMWKISLCHFKLSLPCIPFVHTEYVRARLTFYRQKLLYCECGMECGEAESESKRDLNVKTIPKWLCWVEHKLIFTNACQLYCPANGIHTVVPFTFVWIHYFGILTGDTKVFGKTQPAIQQKIEVSL